MRTKTGIVTSTKMQKTIVVTVDTYKTHPKYKKRYKSSVKFYAHDENGLAKLGDIVTVSETRPLSRLKRWLLVEDSIVSSHK
ncbi:30S ribosomal protein S17 [Candidatus Gracilibacteria bacterium]|nr:30S ribosomal protein S17 [Candidatus Gracilibacteria bacterium]